jgi:predicted dehydrogenase
VKFLQPLNRREFIQWAGAGLAATASVRALGALAQAERNRVELPPLFSKTEANPSLPAPDLPPAERIGYAVVGLGDIALSRVLPAFARSKYARVTALVSGNRAKARKLAAQYGVAEKSIFDYTDFEKIADHPEVQVVYLALPNGLHADYTERAARAKKHVLCEKPMAVSVAECERMISTCKSAGVKLMIAYRSQYEPMDRAIVKLVRSGQLGRPLNFVSTNSQNQGDPSQWRLNQKMAGGGPLPDVGIYCLNAARFLSGEEPVQAWGQTEQLPNDPRFREVESSVQFALKFPSGFSATANASYAVHRSQFFRLECTEGWAELNPAFAYEGLQLNHGSVRDGQSIVAKVGVAEKDQFALELDHLATCVLNDRKPHTPGEEGLQDMKIIAAIYESARTGQPVQLKASAPPHGPDSEIDEAAD